MANGRVHVKDYDSGSHEVTPLALNVSFGLTYAVNVTLGPGVIFVRPPPKFLLSIGHGKVEVFNGKRYLRVHLYYTRDNNSLNQFYK